MDLREGMQIYFFINESGIFLNRIKGWNLGGNRSILKPIKWLVKSIIFTNGDIFKKKSQKEQKKESIEFIDGHNRNL